MKNALLRQTARTSAFAWMPRGLLCSLWLTGSFWFGAGCAHTEVPVSASSTEAAPASGTVSKAMEVRQPVAAGAESTTGNIVRASSHQPIELPPPPSAPASSADKGSGSPHDTLPTPTPIPGQPPAAAPDHEPKLVPINLDTVLRLAEEQNTQLALGREKVYEAQLHKSLADKAWLPDVYVGVDYWRHEGGIVDPATGNLAQPSFGALFGGTEIKSTLDLRELTYQKVKAESKVWEKRADLSKMTHEKLLETSSAYIDLLTARTAEVLAAEIGADLRELHDRAVQAADAVPTAKAMADALKSALHLHYQSVLKLRLEGDAAAARLAYLLGMDRCTQLVPVDEHLVPLDLVDPTVCTDALIDQAIHDGPGVQDLEGLIGTIQYGIDKSHGPGKWLPVFEMRMLEGGFGAGPNDTMDWANRWDLGLQARWNLTDLLVTSKQKSQLAISSLNQAQLSHDDLQGQLALGVRVSHDSIVNGLAQIQASERAIANARSAYKESKVRMEEQAKDWSYEEVLRQIRGLQTALVTKLQSMSEYDKAQLQLRLLLGPDCNKK
jgi:hypothetical protein